jgi:hypothetical protein
VVLVVLGSIAAAIGAGLTVFESSAKKYIKGQEEAGAFDIM